MNNLNFQMDSSNPYILLLCGLPYLRDRLTLNHNRSLAQRLLLPAVPPGREVKGYVDHHMNLAGAKHPIFLDAAMEALAVSTKGYPRLVNKLAVRALLQGFQQKAQQIDADLIRAGALEYGM